jgi:hypothetical protein
MRMRTGHAIDATALLLAAALVGDAAAQAREAEELRRELEAIRQQFEAVKEQYQQSIDGLHEPRAALPREVAVAVAADVRARLLIGWSFGTLVSVLGIAASAALDLPTGATVVCAFGATLAAGWLLARLTGWPPSGPPGAGAAGRRGAAA